MLIVGTIHTGLCAYSGDYTHRTIIHRLQGKITHSHVRHLKAVVEGSVVESLLVVMDTRQIVQ